MNFNDKLFIIEYSGELEENKILLLRTTVITKISKSRQNHINYILISLKNAQILENKFLKFFIGHLEEISIKFNVIIGLIDYKTQVYKILKTFTKDTKIELFRNVNTAKLFLNPEAYKKPLNILVFDEDKENIKKLAFELSEYGYAVTKAKDWANFQQLLKSRKFEFIVTQSILNTELSKANSHRNTLPLSKKMITYLPIFMDTAVDTLVTFTGLKVQKVSLKVSRFNKDLISDVVCALMKFKGDIQGSFILIFPIETAIIAMEALLGEKINKNDTESIMDSVAEFCNTITGNSKTSLSKENIRVLFELPRTFTSLKQAYLVTQENNGIWINMQLESKPFYMFITR